MSKTDSDQILDFINSLPDSKPTTPAPKESENFLEFLDEIASHKPDKKLAPKKREEQEQNKDDEKDDKEANDENKAESDIVDPISSISSWWSSEGSSKVTSLWGTITSNAQTLGETTFQLASQTSNQLNEQRHKYLEGDEQITNISNKLNSILVTMSNQIRQGLISKDDELLNVLVVYDMNAVGYLDEIVLQNFSTVMDQVEGGIRVNVSNYNHRSDDAELNMFYGKIIDGEKLCFANLESAIKEFAEKRKPREEDTESDFEMVNNSNLFISVQPITTHVEGKERAAESATLIEGGNSDCFFFTVMLKDITNDITIITRTQAFPLKWADWLTKNEGEINPGDWVKDWIRGGLDLSMGVVAQEYVIKRMGI